MLLPLSAFAKVFTPLAGARVGYVRMPGNVGDLLIQEATLQLFAKFGIAAKIVNPLDFFGCDDTAVDVFAIAGGGNMGVTYRGCHDVRARLAARTRKPIVVLPQTYTDGDEGHVYHQVWVRERESRRFHPAADVAPDLALGYEVRIPLPAPRHAEGVFLRNDCRWPAWRSRDLGDPVEQCRTAEEYLTLAAAYDTVTTNRLHFAIAARLAGRRAVLLPGTYFKNRAVWECWLRDLGCGWKDETCASS